MLIFPMTYIHTYIYFVKAHVGIYGNELADRLGKEAARSDSTNYEYEEYPRAP
jgi:ribonuclease HI